MWWSEDDGKTWNTIPNEWQRLLTELEVCSGAMGNLENGKMQARPLRSDALIEIGSGVAIGGRLTLAWAEGY